MKNYFTSITVVLLVHTFLLTPLLSQEPCVDRTDDNCLQIATFNIEWFPLGPPEIRKDKNHKNIVARRKSQVAGFIRKGHWEIIAVQELQGGGTMRRFAREELKGTHQYVAGISGQRQRLGYLYRPEIFTLVNHSELFSDKKQKPYYHRNARRPLYAHFKHKASGKEFALINVHLKSNARDDSCLQRQGQVADIAAYAKTIKLPVIILGDFNDTLTENGICRKIDALEAFKSLPDMKFLSSPGNHNPENGVTYINQPYRSVIDHILADVRLLRFVVPQNGKKTTIFEHENKEISDHHPVEVWLKF